MVVQMDEYVLEMDSITKDFPGVRALDQVTLKVRKGEIHALVGENGAGKSTLMKVLSGVYPYGSYTGSLKIKGKERHFYGIKDSEAAGIAIIYQELTMVPLRSVCANICLGNEVEKNGIVNWPLQYKRTQDALKAVKLDINPDTLVRDLSMGQWQLLEIARAIAKNIDILILDEPTGALNEEETDNLLSLLRELKAKGVTCIYISHKLEEVLAIADSITILRDGRTVYSAPHLSIPEHDPEGRRRMTEGEIISHMVGRTITNRYPREPHTPGETVMEVRNWTVYDPKRPSRKLIDNVSFKIRKGEILGIGGLMGAGRTELAMSLIGAYGVKISGQILIDGKPVFLHNPGEAIKHGVSYLSEDRKGLGLILIQNVLFNSTLPSLDILGHNGVIDHDRGIQETNRFVQELRIKTPGIEQKVMNLSGGNQQKVCVAKWMMTKPRILILDEPTRGIDVGAKQEIYMIMNQLVKQGMCIVMISSELPEVLGVSDRILIMHEGSFNGELDWKDATPEKAMLYATGGK